MEGKTEMERRWQHTRIASSVGGSRRFALMLITTLFLSAIAALASPAADPSRQQIVKIVTDVRRADYEGDRAALKRLYGELTPFVENKELASRVRYWRGFALWRRAINGFNEKVDAKELQDDLKPAVEEFDEAARKDPAFEDAKIGAVSCSAFLAYTVYAKDPAGGKDLLLQALQRWIGAQAAVPENPRFLWVIGPGLWNWKPERGGGQAKAMELYEKGLATIRKQKISEDPLEPSWGEPELLMSLAWSELNRTSPDLAAAERYAQSALHLVPYWHYVRDILMPQIQEAKKKTAVNSDAK